MNNTALQTIVMRNLPALSGESITYNATKNIFLTQGYTSAAGNMYYKAIRLSNRLLVYYEIKTVPSRTEPFARLFFLQGCRKHLNFAASIIDTTSRLMLQMLSGGD